MLAHEQEYLDALPSAQMYEKSYMHRDVVTHAVSPLRRKIRVSTLYLLPAYHHTCLHRLLRALNSSSREAWTGTSSSGRKRETCANVLPAMASCGGAIEAMQGNLAMACMEIGLLGVCGAARDDHPCSLSQGVEFVKHFRSHVGAILDLRGACSRLGAQSHL